MAFQTLAIPVSGTTVFTLTPRLGCIPGVAARGSDLACRAVGILEYSRFCDSAVGPRQDMCSIRLNQTSAEVKVEPETASGGFKPRLGLAPPFPDGWVGRPKLALEFPRPPGYPEATVTAVTAVSTMGRDIKRHQMLTIA